MSNASGKLEFTLISDGPTVRFNDFKSEVRIILNIFLFSTFCVGIFWVSSAFRPTDLLLFYEAEYTFFKKTTNKLTESFIFTFGYKDGVLSLINSKLGDYVDRIYTIELDVENIADTVVCFIH